MHPRLSINSLSLGEAGLASHVDTTARLGAAAIGPTLEEVVEYGPVAAARLIDDAGLAVATLTHRAFGFATPDIAAAARARLDDTIAVAGAIGARTITMTTGGREQLAWHAAAARFAEAVAPCAAHARDAGVRLSLEPTSHLYADVSIAHRLTETVALARAAGIGVGIDLFACWTDADIEAAIADAGEVIALVQVSDHVPGDRALPCRAVPGDGAIPLARLLPLIERAGFRGFYDIEVIGPRLWSGDIDAGLRRGAAWLAGILPPA
ncbi:sugar phosphate isomerase/epimerase family protein [Sphingomonas solaris]|uniref:Sugar phosphate isomerase/epimerase n=1 Tax=Alterirhizorhabdus solaris TaxID=2529389 RepID=A0A558RBG6_9SPHN|nr:TIM barrel protein [Sphingomonas solaris]TVV76612.1 sugar phosphate isomerase/epimerase [Sphingomonas solaris]